MIKYLFLFLAGLFVFSNCKKNDDNMGNPIPTGDCSNCLNFNALQVGQQSRYVAFEGEERFETDPETYYQNDTLVVSVIEENNGKFLIEEYLQTNPDSSWQYEMSLDNDNVTFHFFPSDNDPNYPKNSSALLYSWELSFELPKVVSTGKTGSMNGWEFVFDEPCTEVNCMGTIEDYSQLGISYPIVNVYHNYSAMIWDGAGLFMMYHNDYGFIRSVSVGSWIPKGWGWDLIVE